MNIEQIIRDNVRDIPDFPKPGIIFKDITPILKDQATFGKVIDAFQARYAANHVDTIVGIESRGFIFGAALAYALKKPFVPVRKVGKLPYKTVQASYALEYGTATIEMHIDAVQKGDRIIVIDDVLATGGTAEATCGLLEKQGAKILECAFLIELGFLNGKEKLKNREVYSLVQY